MWNRDQSVPWWVNIAERWLPSNYSQDLARFSNKHKLPDFEAPIQIDSVLSIHQGHVNYSIVICLYFVNKLIWTVACQHSSLSHEHYNKGWSRQHNMNTRHIKALFIILLQNGLLLGSFTKHCHFALDSHNGEDLATLIVNMLRVSIFHKMTNVEPLNCVGLSKQWRLRDEFYERWQLFQCYLYSDSCHKSKFWLEWIYDFSVHMSIICKLITCINTFYLGV